MTSFGKTQSFRRLQHFHTGRPERWQTGRKRAPNALTSGHAVVATAALTPRPGRRHSTWAVHVQLLLLIAVSALVMSFHSFLKTQVERDYWNILIFHFTICFYGDFHYFFITKEQASHTHTCTPTCTHTHLTVGLLISLVFNQNFHACLSLDAHHCTVFKSNIRNPTENSFLS